MNILRSRPYRRALWRGTPAAVEHADLLRSLDCTTVVDIGANRGQFTLVAHCCFPDAAIFAFEPQPGAGQLFQRVLGNEKGVKLHQHAIGANAGSCEMHISRRDDSSSLLPIGELQTKVFPGTAECRRQWVAMERLDSVLRATDIRPHALLKIDVEGYELEVLKGCTKLLDRFTYIYVEASFVQLNDGQPLADEVIDYLRCRGFQLKGIFNVSYDKSGYSVQGDFLFTATHLMSTPLLFTEARLGK